MNYIKLILLFSILLLSLFNKIFSQDDVLTIYNCHPKGYGKIAFKDYSNDNSIYSTYLVEGKLFDTLWVTSSIKQNHKTNVYEQSELFYAIRTVAKRSDCISKGWSKLYPLNSSDVYNKFNRGTIALWNNSIITSSEIPIINSFNSEIQGSSFKNNLILISINSQGDYLVEIDPDAFKNINSDKYWNSQPSLSIDEMRLFFVSNRPLPDRPKSTDLNIWYSDYHGSKFSKPLPLNDINSIYDEMSPHCSIDGKFYYSSNMKRNNLNTKDYDIYVADLVNGLPDDPENINKIYEENECINDSRYMINTSDNEVFPFVTHDSSSILFSSDKTNNDGIYSVFAVKMQPPCIKLNVNITENLKENIDKVINTNSIKYNDMQLLLNSNDYSIPFTPKDTLILDPKTEYSITYSFDSLDCYNCLALPESIQFVTPNNDAFIQKDIIFNCVKDYSLRPIISLTYAVPFYIDDYWKPSTSKNIREYIGLIDDDMLDSTMMYDVIAKNYGLVSDEIDNVIENTILRDIINIIPELQRCWDTLSIRIDIHGFSDSCSVNSIFCCEGDIQIKDFIINDSLNLSKRFVKDIHGQMVRLEKNELLTLLRSYYLFENLSNIFEDNIPNYLELKKNNLITLDYKGNGIYNNNCNIFDDALNRYSIMPEKLDSCSNPMHNVVFIHINVIGREDIKYHNLDECGSPSKEYLKRRNKSKFKYREIKQIK